MTKRKRSVRRCSTGTRKKCVRKRRRQKGGRTPKWLRTVGKTLGTVGKLALPAAISAGVPLLGKMAGLGRRRRKRGYRRRGRGITLAGQTLGRGTRMVGQRGYPDTYYPPPKTVKKM